MTIINNTALIEQIKGKKHIIEELKQNEEAFIFFIKAFKPRFCWSSNQIEGNTLTLEETLDLIEYDEVKSNHTFEEYREAKNLYKAINDKIKFDYCEITNEWIKSSNSIIMSTECGYRQKNVYIGNQFERVYIPPKYEEIPKLMKEYCENINSFENDDVKEQIQKIVLDHIKFERIHPFVDGNGRTGRMVLNQQLINTNFLPICITKNSKYHQAFRKYDQNKDVSLMEHIICKEILDTLKIAEDLLSKHEI